MTFLKEAGAARPHRSHGEERASAAGAALGIHGDNDFTCVSSLRLPENYGIAINMETGECKREVAPGIFETDKLEKVASRYLMRASAKNLLQGIRKSSPTGNSYPVYLVVRCGLGVMNEISGVSIWKNTEYKSTHFGGLVTCGSIWHCSICASKIQNRRKAELVLATSRNHEQGGFCGLLTCTIPHVSTESCGTVLTSLQKLFTGLNSGKASNLFNSRHNIFGQIRALEFTHGFHGWHPHVHSLVFTENLLCWDTVADEFYRRWSRSAKSNFGWDLPRQSIDFRGGDKAARYISKWGIEDEITSGFQKQAKGKNRSPWGLLSDYSQGDNIAGEKWRDFATSVSRQGDSTRLVSTRQLVWSRGLRQRFGINEISDEEIASSQEEPAVLLGTLSFDDWIKVLNQNYDCRPVLLQIAALGNMKDVRNFVNQLPETSRTKLII